MNHEENTTNNQGRMAGLLRRLLVETALGPAIAAAATLAVFSALLLLSNGAAAQAKQVTVRGCDGEGVELSQKEWKMVSLHNQEREAEGLDYLCVSPELSEAANSHSQAMIEKNYFSHYGPDGDSTPGKRLEGAGYKEPRMYGENIALGSGAEGEPEDRFEALMNSEEHKKQVLKEGYRQAGVGAKTGDFSSIDGDTTVYTINFATKKGQSGAHEEPEVIEGMVTTSAGDTVSTTPEGTTPEGTAGGGLEKDQIGGRTVSESPPDPDGHDNNPATTSGGKDEQGSGDGGGEPPASGSENPPAHSPASESSSGENPEGDSTSNNPRQQVAFPEEGSTDQKRSAGVKDRICENFAQARQDAIGDLLRDAEEGEGPGAQVKRQIAEDFQDDLLNPGYCDFGPVAVEGQKEMEAAGDRAEAAEESNNHTNNHRQGPNSGSRGGQSPGAPSSDKDSGDEPVSHPAEGDSSTSGAMMPGSDAPLGGDGPPDKEAGQASQKEASGDSPDGVTVEEETSSPATDGLGGDGAASPTMGSPHQGDPAPEEAPDLPEGESSPGDLSGGAPSTEGGGGSHTTTDTGPSSDSDEGWWFFGKIFKDDSSNSDSSQGAATPGPEETSENNSSSSNEGWWFFGKVFKSGSDDTGPNDGGEITEGGG